MIGVNEVSHEEFVKERRVTVRNSCDDCANAPICKFTPGYTQAKSDFQKMELPEVVKIELSCKYYANEHKNVRKVDMRGREYSPDGSIKPSTKYCVGDEI